MAHQRFKRICVIVFDSLGIGELPDATSYGDAGANTLLHTDDARGGLKIPHLEKMGLRALVGRGSEKNFNSAFCRLSEKSRGKDTTTGHWEMMGLVLQKPFQTFLTGFPAELMNSWSQTVGLGFLGNKPASGTEIIKELGEEHVKSGKPIVYTSADSVFQIACHEKYFGLQKLYDLCEKTRAFLNASSFQVGRVIARPFVGEPGQFARTENRKDYSVNPFDATVLDQLTAGKIPVTGVGKIPSIFNYRGITKIYDAHNDRESIDATLKALQSDTGEGVIFSNLNDLDMLYGHRRDAQGYGKQLEFIDSRIPEILGALQEDDLLLITADNGNDPTYKGTDHTREYTPLLAYSKNLKVKGHLNDRSSFSDVGQTLLENFKIKPLTHAKSLLSDI